jgi:hypothetical protein
MSYLPIPQLINPQSDSNNHKEQRKLDDGGQYQNKLIDTVDGHGSANTFKGLPPK